MVTTSSDMVSAGVSGADVSGSVSLGALLSLSGAAPGAVSLSLTTGGGGGGSCSLGDSSVTLDSSTSASGAGASGAVGDKESVGELSSVMSSSSDSFLSFKFD